MKEKTLVGLSCAVIVAIYTVATAISTWLWLYTVNAWLAYSGSNKVLPWYIALLIAFIPALGQLALPAALFTYIFMLFVG